MGVAERRLDELTAIRGVAALGVVLMHAGHEWNPVFRTGWDRTNLVAGGGIWVHFFFVLSGFVISHAYAGQFERRFDTRRFARFMVVRFGRIYPLYGVVLLLWTLFVAWRWIPANDPPGSLVASYLLVQGFTYGDDVWNYPGWSISAEWFAYLAFPFVALGIARLDGRGVRLLAVVLSAAVVVLFGCGYTTNAYPPMALVYCLVEFALGVAVHSIASASKPGSIHPLPATLVALFPIVLLALPPGPASGWILGVAAVGCAATILVISGNRTYLDRALRSRPLQFAGLVSYSIYLNHAILFRSCKALADLASGRHHTIESLSPIEAAGAFAVYLLLLLVVSWLTWRLVEEPLRLRFRQLAGSPSGSQAPAPRPAGAVPDGPATPARDPDRRR